MLGEFLKFLRNPSLQVEKKQEVISVRILLKIFVALIVAKIIGLLVMGSIFFLMNPITGFIRELGLMEFAYTKQQIPHSTLEKVLIGMMIAPIIEELVFRLPLVYKDFFLSLSIALLFFILMPGYYIRFGVDIYDSYWFIVLISSIILFVVLFIFIRRRNVNVKKFYYRNYIVIFYFTNILFGLIHIGNEQSPTWYLLLMAPFYLLPHILPSLVYSFVRIKHGITCSILVHILMNFSIILLSII